MKDRRTYTIDEINVHWLEQKAAMEGRKGVSEIVNELLTKARESSKDVFQEFEYITHQYLLWNEKLSEIDKKLLEVVEEGNKKERERAEQLLRQKKVQQERELSILVEKVNRIKEGDLLDYLIENKEIILNKTEGWKEVLNHFLDRGVKVGWSDLRGILQHFGDLKEVNTK
tara:strand:- start:298 stop:810 length:513 start_codon:yes stop_codon:yes gene_type:complete